MLTSSAQIFHMGGYISLIQKGTSASFLQTAWSQPAFLPGSTVVLSIEIIPHVPHTSSTVLPLTHPLTPFPEQSTFPCTWEHMASPAQYSETQFSSGVACWTWRSTRPLGSQAHSTCPGLGPYASTHPISKSIQNFQNWSNNTPYKHANLGLFPPLPSPHPTLLGIKDVGKFLGSFFLPGYKSPVLQKILLVPSPRYPAHPHTRPQDPAFAV